MYQSGRKSERLPEYPGGELLDLGEEPTPDVGNVSMCGLYLSGGRELQGIWNDSIAFPDSLRWFLNLLVFWVRNDFPSVSQLRECFVELVQ